MGYGASMTSLWHATRPSAPDRALGSEPLPDRADLVVVGGGLTGLTTALLAQRAGLDTLVLEGRTIGAAASGNTTAKISLLQGTVLSNIRKHHDQGVVDAYVRGAAAATRFGGAGGQRAHRAEVAASGLAWVVAGVVAVALAGVALW